MKRFETLQIDAAIAYALAGGQAFHLHSFNRWGHPVFRPYPRIAHLFDQDRERLFATARRLGVRVIKIERVGTPQQHVDLCGRPFDKALKETMQEVLV